MHSAHLGALDAADLISRVARGDQPAFAELYDRYSARVLGLSIRLVANRAIAEEVTQEVFLELWQKAARFHAGKGDPAAWILTVTRMRAIDRIRSEQSMRDRLVKVGVREYQPATADVDDSIERIETKRTVDKALRILTKTQREAVSLYYSGYTHAELARILHVPLGTAKSRVHDGVVRLRAHAAVAMA